ncbi:MAG TPA: Ku protein [Myxococcota bacterium]|nr:Ku protein [Myxococcota bacterium]
MPRKRAKRRPAQRGGARANAKRDTPARDSSRPSDSGRPRGLWSGSLTFGLVTIPVELYSATRSSAVPLRMLGPDGVPLAREYVCAKHEQPLAEDEIERGYEVDGKFVIVTDEELEQLAPRRSRDIELTRFVARDTIDPAYFVRPYVVVPGGEQTKAYRLLADVMEKTGRAALASFVMRGKAYAVAIFADRGILRAETLRFADELRDPAAIGIRAPEEPDAKRVAALKRAIAKLEERTLSEKELSDDSSERLLELARNKRKRGEDVVEAPKAPAAEAPTAEEPATGAPAEGGGEVIDLLAVIQQRLRESGARRGPARKRANARRPTRR